MSREIMCGVDGIEHAWSWGSEFCQCGSERSQPDSDDNQGDDTLRSGCGFGWWEHVFTRDRTSCLCGSECQPAAVCSDDEHVWFGDDDTCECGDVTNPSHNTPLDAAPTQIEADDPDFDGDPRFPRITEDRDGPIWQGPFRNSQWYRRHCRQWSKRPPAEALADLRRLLPRLKAVRSVSTVKERRRRQERKDSAKGIRKEPRWNNVELLVFVRADERWQPRFWRELKRHDPRLILQIERGCRQEPNKLAGRKSGKS
jgi:hypothetical protein